MTRTALPPASTSESPDAIAVGGLVALALIWGSSFALVEIALTALSPVAIAAARIWLATLAVVAVTLATGHRLPIAPAAWAWCGAIGVLSLVAPFTLLAWGQQQVPSTLASIYISAGPLFMLALARLTIGTRITVRRAAGFVIGFAGIVWLIGPDALGAAGVTGITGQLACLLASLSYAAGSIVIRVMPQMPALSATAAATIIASALIAPAGFAFWPQAAVPMPVIGAVLALGLVQTGVAQVLRYFTVRRAGPVFMSTVGYLIPIWAGILGIAVLGEEVTLRSILAYLMILTGLVVARPGSD